MSENTLVNDTATDATSDTLDNQAAAKTYNQQEVDAMMARMRTSLEKKLLRPYQDLGDPEELRTLRSDADKRAQDQQIKRGEFEKTLQANAAKWEAEISKRDTVIKEYRVNVPLLSAAARYNAVNAEQVKALLSHQVRMNDSGEVEVVDAKGAVRYTDTGELVAVDSLVREFLDSNPHFRSANPATVNTRSTAATQGTVPLDVSKLNMQNPEHRAVYKQHRKSLGLS